MRLSDIFKTAVSNLMCNKGRTILTVIAIFIGAFTISLTNGVNLGINDYIDQQVNGIGGENSLIIQPKIDFSANSGEGPAKYNPDQQVNTVNNQRFLTKKDLAELRQMTDLKQVDGIQSLSVDYITRKSADKYVFSVTQSLGDLSVELESGQVVDNKSDQQQITLSPEYVEALGFSSSEAAVGQKVQLGVSSAADQKQEQIEALIVGVQTPNILQGGGTSMVNRTLSNKINEINSRNLPNADNQQFVAAFGTMKEGLTDKQIDQLKEKLDKNGYMGMTIDDQINMIRNVIGAITGVLTMFAAISLVAASFGIVNTLFMSVQERTREIGLMKAMGLSSWKIFVMFSVEAMLIGFLGSVCGILGGYGAGQLINHLAGQTFLKDLTGFTLVQFSLSTSLAVTAVIMLIALVSGTIPSRRAAKLDPITALRYE